MAMVNLAGRQRFSSYKKGDEVKHARSAGLFARSTIGSGSGKPTVPGARRGGHRLVRHRLAKRVEPGPEKEGKGIDRIRDEDKNADGEASADA